MEVHVSLTDRRRLSEQIYRQLRAAIRAGRLRPARPCRRPGSWPTGWRCRATRSRGVRPADRRGLPAEPAGQRHLRQRRRAALAGAASAAAGGCPRPRPLWARHRIGASTRADAAGDRLPGRHPGRAAVPVRDLAGRSRPTSSGRPPSAAARTSEPAGMPGAAGGDRPPRRRLARRCAPTPTTCSSPAAASRRSTWSPGCCSAPGDVVAVEDPGYPPPRNALPVARRRVVGVPVDAEGLVVDALPDGRAARLRDAVAPVPARDADVAAPAPRPPRLGRTASTRRSSRTTTTASSASAGRPLEPLQASTAPAGCSTSARSPRPCCRRCGWAS